MKTLKLIKRLFLLLCLIMAGTQSAWAQSSGYRLVKEATVGNLTFDLYKYYTDYGITHFDPFAVLKGISDPPKKLSSPTSLKTAQKIIK